MTDLVPVVVAHPLSTLTDEEIAERALQASGQAVAVWLGPSGSDEILDQLPSQ